MPPCQSGEDTLVSIWPVVLMLIVCVLLFILLALLLFRPIFILLIVVCLLLSSRQTAASSLLLWQQINSHYATEVLCMLAFSTLSEFVESRSFVCRLCVCRDTRKHTQKWQHFLSKISFLFQLSGLPSFPVLLENGVWVHHFEWQFPGDAFYDNQTTRAAQSFPDMKLASIEAQFGGTCTCTCNQQSVKQK